MQTYRHNFIFNSETKPSTDGWWSLHRVFAEDLGAGVGKLGKAYKSVQQEIVESGITGKYLFSVVKDDETQFKSFVADNFGVSKPLQQSFLFSNYNELLLNDGDGVPGTTEITFDIRDTIQRPPKDILSELFQIQGISLDPDNVTAAVDKIAAAVRSSVGDQTGCDGESSFDCFISYRVAADKDIAEKIYDKLLLKGLYPFLDKVKLKDGMDWKDGFMQGLKGSKCFISLISRKALESCRDKTINHTWDNVLLEIETALRYKSATGNGGYIIPVTIGEWLNIDGVGRVLKKFEEFGGNLYADTIEGTSAVAPAPVAPAATTAVGSAHSASVAPAGTVATIVHAAPATTVATAKLTRKLEGKCAMTLTGHTMCVWCVMQLADGRVCSGSHDTTIKIWDVGTGACAMTLTGHTDYVRIVMQLADGRVCSGSGDKTIKIWDVGTGACAMTLTGHTDYVSFVMQLADGRVCSGSGDKTIKIWE